ncbi:MAG: hypothetical protein QOI04_1102 [Verrucomicrobiota bacterium]|jgi:predicted O-methyltransferase YrrM
MNQAQLSFLSADENRRWNEMRGRLLTSGAELLFRFATESDSAGAAVEIGSFAGKSTVCIARGLQARKTAPARLFAIDMHFQPDFKTNLVEFGVSEIVESIAQPSLDAAETWTQPISFLYIDAHHGRAHAYADLMVWDMMMVPGGYVALDDTSGFLLGPNLQLQAALRTDAYELVAEAGGMSVLQKKQSLLPFLSDFPLLRGSLVAYVQFVSAWLGAMNLDFRAPHRPETLPRPTRRRNNFDAAFTRFWDRGPRRLARAFIKKSAPDASPRDAIRKTGEGAKAGPKEAQRILEWLRAGDHDESVARTLMYLDSCLDLRLSRRDSALEKFAKLSELDRALHFLHYKIPVRDMSILRLAQAHDLSSARNLAQKEYVKLIQETGIPEIRRQAQLGLSTPFQIPELNEKLLLREYAFDLSAYRSLVYG